MELASQISLRFLESICYEKNTYPLLELHQQRLNRVFDEYFPMYSPHNLKVSLPALNSSNVRKVRVIYDGISYSITHEEYQIRPIKSIQLIRSDPFDYGFKYEDRSKLNSLFELRGKADDILIIKNGMVTDSYYANPVFWDGKEWFVPKTYLLNGVRRQHLLRTGQVREMNIGAVDLQNFEKVSLVNAMMDLGEVEIQISKIKA